jgi:hypothetical protein
MGQQTIRTSFELIRYIFNLYGGPHKFLTLSLMKSFSSSIYTKKDWKWKFIKMLDVEWWERVCPLKCTAMDEMKLGDPKLLSSFIFAKKYWCRWLLRDQCSPSFVSYEMHIQAVYIYTEQDSILWGTRLYLTRPMDRDITRYRCWSHSVTPSCPTRGLKSIVRSICTKLYERPTTLYIDEFIVSRLTLRSDLKFLPLVAGNGLDHPANSFLEDQPKHCQTSSCYYFEELSKRRIFSFLLQSNLFSLCGHYHRLHISFCLLFRCAQWTTYDIQNNRFNSAPTVAVTAHTHHR